MIYMIQKYVNHYLVCDYFLVVLMIVIQTKISQVYPDAEQDVQEFWNHLLKKIINFLQECIAILENTLCRIPVFNIF